MFLQKKLNVKCKLLSDVGSPSAVLTLKWETNPLRANHLPPSIKVAKSSRMIILTSASSTVARRKPVPTYTCKLEIIWPHVWLVYDKLCKRKYDTMKVYF